MSDEKPGRAPGPWKADARELLRVRPGFDLATFDRSSSPGLKDVAKAPRLLAKIGEKTSDLQERLYADGRTGGTRRVLLVLQGMDTAGKGGIVRHVMGMVDPQGVALHSFGVPSAEERKHHYLWRIRRALPPAGRIGVFDRSHYEDVLVVRVDSIVPQEVWEARYDEINRFEAGLVADGVSIVKVALLVSYDEQYRRLHARLERPDKYWKFNPSDVDSRSKWPAYQEAYQAVFDRTSTDVAPWYAVPADSKDYARLAVSQLLLQTLTDLNLDWPAADYDVAAERTRLEATR
jgi:PPK2 family polyphosphate:nucleotide phosphotransferase